MLVYNRRLFIILYFSLTLRVCVHITECGLVRDGLRTVWVNGRMSLKSDRLLKC
eukprot:SAG31_NODE_1423_length_8400_cov_2.665944_11_plen_53_part_01